jgi:hypothetical protein
MHPDIAKVKSIINPTDKIIMAKKDILPLKFPVEQSYMNNKLGKPSGLWYAIGTEWIDWVEVEMPHWMGSYFYKITTSNKVLKIDDANKFEQLAKKYATTDNNIDWIKISNIYSGIEIAPYRPEYRMEYMWYYGWDIASGCVWKRDAITNIQKIEI